jgi:Nicotinic acid mononucleotide adenylyltransferase
LPEPLYTYNTLSYLKTKYPDDELILIIGADNCAELERWYRGCDLIKEYEIWVYPRIGFDTRELCKKYGCVYLDAPIVDISSTLIREMESKGKDMSQYKNISYFCAFLITDKRLKNKKKWFLTKN